MIKTNKYTGEKEIIEIISNDVLIRGAEDVLDLVSRFSAEYFILYEHNIDSEFFDLSSGLAGEVLQKLTNYHIKLAIVGDFDKFPSKTLKSFIYESNKNKEYLFVHSLEEALKIWNS